jgi:hypothetical protein
MSSVINYDARTTVNWGVWPPNSMCFFVDSGGGMCGVGHG